MRAGQESPCWPFVCDLHPVSCCLHTDDLNAARPNRKREIELAMVTPFLVNQRFVDAGVDPNCRPFSHEFEVQEEFWSSIAFIFFFLF